VHICACRNSTGALLNKPNTRTRRESSQPSVIMGHWTLLICAFLRRLAASLSPRRSGFDPRPVHVRYVMEEVVLGQVLFWVLQLSPVSISVDVPYSSIHLLSTLHNLQSLNNTLKICCAGGTLRTPSLFSNKAWLWWLLIFNAKCSVCLAYLDASIKATPTSALFLLLMVYFLHSCYFP